MLDQLSISAMPYPFHCDIEKTALVIIDMQNDFCASGGFAELLGNDVSYTKAVIPTIRVVLDLCRQFNMLVIHTREGHLADLSDCPPSKLKRSKAKGAGIGDIGPMGRILVRGEKGHAIVPELAPLEAEWIIDKPGKGAFFDTMLDMMLKSQKIESLILTGVTTHVCVHTTLREANDRGYECLVLEDATAAFDPNDQAAAIRMIHQQGGIFGWVSNAASLLNSLYENRKSG